MKKKNLFLVECLVKATVFLLLMFLVLFLTSCSEKTEQMPSGEMLHYEVDNPENTMWRTYTIEDDSVDLFDKWQAEQKNTLAQREWDAYMKDDN